MSRRSATQPRWMTKAILHADTQHQLRIARRAADALRSTLPLNEQAVRDALAVTPGELAAPATRSALVDRLQHLDGWHNDSNDLDALELLEIATVDRPEDARSAALQAVHVAVLALAPSPAQRVDLLSAVEAILRDGEPDAVPARRQRVRSRQPQPRSLFGAAGSLRLTHR